jgi:hypothetical protein
MSRTLDQIGNRTIAPVGSRRKITGLGFMRRFRALLPATLTIALAVLSAVAFESVYDVTVGPRRPEPTSATTVSRHDRSPLPLRLVDSGGVGVPLVAWGKDYQHDLRTFRDVILEDPPYIDLAALNRVDREWRAYAERMLAYGNNAIVVPLLLELIDFDGVYEQGSPFLARHEAVRRHLGPLLEWTSRRGLKVFLSADMLSLTPALARHLRAVSPGSNPSGINTSDPTVWSVYRAGLQELFDRLPYVEGLVIRIGEAGALYNTAGWDYRSEVAVRDAASLGAMLRGLLPLFETKGKSLVLRSWTVGVGRLGRLHIDPAVYDAALGGIDSPSLIVSTKFTAGDFFSYLPLNPTLLGGRHRRIVELQARPEFEGFGAFPDFLGDEHGKALRALTSANPRIVGTYVWSQLGGPLRAGPRSLYPVHGFWLWTDVNVFVASRLALNPGADVNELVRTWASDTFAGEPGVAGAVARLLTTTRDAVRKGFYIRTFAEREVRVRALELPPLMWIFEWDRLGGWHSLLSLVYRAARDEIDVAITEGEAAAATVRQARQDLVAALAARRPGACGTICDETARSLEYQETLFDALAAWRQAFLSYYRWLETGDLDSWARWTAGRTRFEAAAARHIERFGGDLDFPAFDLTSSAQAITIANRGGWIRGAAWVLLIGVAALFGASRVRRIAWAAALAPWRLERRLDLRSALALSALSLALIACVAGGLAGFTTVWLSAGVLLVVGSVGLALEGTASEGEGHGRLLVALLGSLIPGSIVVLGLLAYWGPLGFWYGFWIVPAIRMTVVAVLVATIVWAAIAMAAASRGRWYRRLGGSLASLGVGLLAATILLPDWVDVLRFLDRPLNFAPATETMIIALQTYVSVSLDAGAVPWVVGALAVGGGLVLKSRSNRAPTA